MHICKKQLRGFTLLEVMVALLIVAVALSALVKGAAGKAYNASFLRNKTFAQWVAINKATEWRVQKLFPQIGERSGSQIMGQQEWYWSAKFESTFQKGMRRVVISVYKDEKDKDDKKQPITKVVSFLSKT